MLNLNLKKLPLPNDDNKDISMACKDRNREYQHKDQETIWEVMEMTLSGSHMPLH